MLMKKILQKLIKVNKLNNNICTENLDDPENLNKLVKDLLIKHYDPAYKKSMNKNFTKL